MILKQMVLREENTDTQNSIIIISEGRERRAQIYILL